MNLNDRLFDACRDGDLDTVKNLIAIGVDIHTYDDEALRWAAHRRHLEVVKLLLENGANVHADDDWALRWAVLNKHFNIAKLLIEKGADTSYLSNWTGYSEFLKEYERKT